jgi:hypothetical protein
LGRLRAAFWQVGGVIPYALELAFLSLLWATTAHWYQWEAMAPSLN